ncbi:hypothetical protein KIN20_024523 [Parelaphostrongylus tenuis]|uniref:Uncharacterized protein n=1 Tax=Parelaphostrongylus tenuis TaxID=148309 RepID=A0AAD5MTM9_PARTN|nr:hypothetical protein KIN20_024523 [Parelaphostrongylus tenuis]
MNVTITLSSRDDRLLTSTYHLTVRAHAITVRRQFLKELSEDMHKENSVGLVVHSNTGVGDETFACNIIGMKRQSGALATD